MLPIVRIQPGSNLKKLVEVMREAAQRDYIKESPVYAKTVDQALADAAPQADAILSDGRTRILQFVEDPNRFVSVVLSIDAYPNEPLCWHLSLGFAPMAIGEEPGRVGDALAKRISTAFEATNEGPPEGVFKHVRHFRAPYLPT